MNSKPAPPTNAPARLARLRRRPAPSRPARPWPVTANGLLLVLEASGFVMLGALYLGPLGTYWRLTPETWQAGRIAILTGVGFALLALLALVAALGFFRLRRGAWVIAVTVQGIELLAALILYYRGRPAYVYLMMVYGVLMVLYLHQSDVQAVFHTSLDEVNAEHTA